MLYKIIMKYICLRCGYDAKQKINLESHLNRKNICEPIDDFISIDEVKKHYGFDTFDEKKLNGPQLSSKTPHFSSKILKLTSSKILKKVRKSKKSSSKILKKVRKMKC